MNREERAEALDIARRLLLGTQVVGALWFGVLVIILDRVDAQTPPKRIVYDQLYLHAESRLVVFPTAPLHYPNHLDEIPDLSLPERVTSLVRLARHNVVGVTLGDPHAHLILTFDSGAVLTSMDTTSSLKAGIWKRREWVARVG